MSRRSVKLHSFEARSLLLIASIVVATAGSAHAQSTAMPAAATPGASEVTAAFTKADKNADGKLSREEAAALPAVAANFDKVDADKDGMISAAEFGKAMKM